MDALMEGRMDDPLAKRMLDENMERRIQKEGETMAPPNMLSRVDLDLILKGITSRDLFAAFPEGVTVSGAEVAGAVFEKAAERQGYGAEALDRVSVQDGIYLAGQLGELFSEGPKGVGTKGSRTSPASGG
jgi:hypothetical protein